MGGPVNAPTTSFMRRSAARRTITATEIDGGKEPKSIPALSPFVENLPVDSANLQGPPLTAPSTEQCRSVPRLR